jgi:uncharacterized coiled-coil protein SlyX
MPEEPSSLEQRLERIESHLAHVERLYDELNQVVVQQADVLRRMQAQERRLSESMEAMELERIKSTNPRPPHYGP